MSFRLWTIFYVFALLAAAMATFGPWGIVVAALVLAFWGWMYSAHRPRTLVEWLVLIAIVLMLAALMVPAVQAVRESSRRAQCMNNLKQLALALLDYESKNGSLPPAYVADPNGTPLHSWRALILPRVERADLYDQLDFAKPWNDPANRIASLANVELFHCPNDSSQLPSAPTTSYFAVVGRHTAWPDGRGRRMSEITDRRTHTILLIEAVGKNIPWAQPSDMTFDEAVQLLTESPPAEELHVYSQRDGFFYKDFGETRSGIHVAMADGQIRFLVLPLPKELAIALLTVDGGEGEIHDQLDYYSRPQLDYAKCYVFGVFVILSLLPAAWVRRRGAKANGDSQQKQHGRDEHEFGVAADAKDAV